MQHLWEKCVSFHGHACPGLAIGFRVAHEWLGMVGFSKNEEIPESTRLFTSIFCKSCGESAPEHKMRLQGGQKVCLDCFTQYSRGF